MIKPETILHRLRNLYKDAHGVEAENYDQLQLWAGNDAALHAWAEYKIRYCNWGWMVCHSTIASAQRLSKQLSMAVIDGQDPFDFLVPTAQVLDD